MQVKARPLTGRSFYLGMMITIVVLILYGFSHTVEADLFSPAEQPPAILYIHVATFTTWLLVLLSQSVLVWSRNARLHMKLGWLGLAFAAAMVLIGIATTVIMGQVQVRRLGPDAGMFIYRPFEDILFFATAFGLAIHWRKRPDIHRRLMVLAACALTPPAISRIPGIHSLGMVYLGTDFLILAAVLHDLMTIRQVHAVYRWGVVSAVIGQSALLLVMSRQPAAFVEFAGYITR